MDEKYCDCNKINHINCEVKSCVYHGEGNICEAETVKVKNCGGLESSCSDDTACQTFKLEG